MYLNAYLSRYVYSIYEVISKYVFLECVLNWKCVPKTRTLAYSKSQAKLVKILKVRLNLHNFTWQP